MSSVRKIAERAGVSTCTVSRALNNDPAVKPKTRDRVLAVARSVGYVPTTGRRSSTNIAFVHTGDRTLSSVYDSALMEGILSGLDECRFDVVILNLLRDKKAEETYAQFFMRKGVRGVILRTTAESRHICQAIADEEFPMVVIGERFDAPNVSFIDCDSTADSVRAVEYLIALGHRRIAFAMHVVPDRDHRDRFEAYKRALANKGLEFDDALVFRIRSDLAGGATVMEMAMRMDRPPTAIYAADPLLAVGAVNKAYQLGVHIPRDISIVGFDDAKVRYSVPPTLTAVCQDASRLGFEASVQLTRMVTKRTAEHLRKTMPSFFEVHDSTGPPPDDGPRIAPPQRRSHAEIPRPQGAGTAIVTGGGAVE